MESNIESMKQELDDLRERGNNLYLAMIDDVQGLPGDFKKKLKADKVKLPNFKIHYDSWYSEALAVVKQLLPDRLDDFVKTI